MARGVNKVILIGNLGQDPEVRYLPNGNAVTNITLATSDSWKDRETGQQQERTEWHRIVFFGKIAEIAGQYLRKGSKVFIEGALRTRKWQDNQGQDRYTTEIVVDMNGQMQMLDGVSNNGVPQNPSQQSQQPPANMQRGGGQQAPQGQQRGGGQQQQQRQPNNQQQMRQTQQPQGGYDDFENDDIPF